MRKNYIKRIKELHTQGFTVCELAIMYGVAEFKINLALEWEGDSLL